MEKRSYSSFEDLDKDIKIKQLERSIAFEKVKKEFLETKSSITPSSLIGNYIQKFTSIPFGNPIVKWLITYFAYKFINRKRG